MIATESETMQAIRKLITATGFTEDEGSTLGMVSSICDLAKDRVRLADKLITERDKLREWKASAMSVTPPLQEIAKEIGVPLGESIHDKILPWIVDAKRRLAAHENQSHAAPHKCPCCDGTGLTLRPPWVAGDAPGWDATTAAVHQCKACGGAGILWSQPSTGRAE